MPRWLTFQVNGTEVKAYLQKFSRDMLYGKSRVERRSEDGKIYRTAYLTSDGTNILTSDGFGSNYMTPKGKIPLKVIKVDEQGEPLPIQPSMFKGAITLEHTIPLQDYFHYEIEYSYILHSDADLTPIKRACERAWEERQLHVFPYAYYETTLSREAILILKDDTIFVIVGTHQQPLLTTQSDIMYLDEVLEQQLEEELIFEVW
jgi:hypothetical protein